MAASDVATPDGRLDSPSAPIDGMVADLIALQAELPTVRKDGENPHYKSKFASLTGIMETVRPLLAKHNFAWVTFPQANESGQLVLTYKLVHQSGEQWSGDIPLLLGQQTPQAQGSAITYARRYALCAVLGIVGTDDDDDGEGASQRATNGHQSTAALRPASKAPEPAPRAANRGICLACRDAGYKARSGDTPKFVETPRGVLCTGIREDGEHAAHDPDATDLPDEIPF